jgi:hypothetical protein
VVNAVNAVGDGRHALGSRSRSFVIRTMASLWKSWRGKRDTVASSRVCDGALTLSVYSEYDYHD